MKKKLIDYQVICENSLSALKIRVEQYVNNGYELLGGVSVVHRTNPDVCNLFYQTFVKYED